jgi:hypothetical protein
VKYLITFFIILTCILVASIPSIHDWERRNDYPFGRMCDPNIFNGYHSSCREVR